MQNDMKVYDKLCELATMLDVLDEGSRVMQVELKTLTGTRSDKVALKYMSLRAKSVFESLQQYEKNLMLQRLSLHDNEDLHKKIQHAAIN